MNRHRLTGIAAVISCLALSACGSDKPSKAEVTKGIISLVDSSGNQSENAELTKVATCITDKVYGDLSDEEAKMLADPTAALSFSPQTQEAFEAAAKACADI